MNLTVIVNSIIGWLADSALGLCMLLAVYMVNQSLAMVMAGLFCIRLIADTLVRRENDLLLQNILKEAENNINKRNTEN